MRRENRSQYDRQARRALKNPSHEIGMRLWTIEGMGISIPVRCDGSLPTCVHAPNASTKAIVLGWDGAVSAFVHEMLRLGELPNLAKLIEGGAFADDVIPCFPSLTAPGFASLWTGAPPRITGISGNRVPRLPREPVYDPGEQCRI